MRTFTARVTCRFALLVTATTAAVLTIGGVLLDRQIVAGLDQLHAVEADELGELLGSGADLDRSAVSHRIKHDADSDAALFVMQVSRHENEVVFRSDNLADTILPAASGAETHGTTDLPFLGSVYLSNFTRGPWRIQIGSPLQPAERMLHEYVRLALPLLAVTGLCSLAVGYAFSRATLRPVRAIEATAKRIRAEALSERIPVTSAKDELAGLSILLNQMFDRLQASFEEVRQFSADASHELKTPLSLIRLNAERLCTKPHADPEVAAALGDILEETARIQQVIDRLLFLARADGGALQPKRQEFDAREFIEEFGADAAVLCEDRGIRFQIEANTAGMVRADPDLLRQVLLNLITNAMAVSAAGQLVTIASTRTEAAWSLIVADEGPGMSAEQIGRAFQRFVRFPQSGKGERPGGHGLGLPICKSIVELHGGRIIAENKSGASGLRVRVELPPATG